MMAEKFEHRTLLNRSHNNGLLLIHQHHHHHLSTTAHVRHRKTMEPLTFSMPQPQHPDSLKIMVHQATVQEEEQSEQHDVGLVMWPSAVMLSRWITEHPSVVLDHGANGDILELGAGCGLVGLTAASLLRQDQQHQPLQQQHHQPLQQQQHKNKEVISNNNKDEEKETSGNVIFTDYNETACKNLERNARLNDLDTCTSVVGLDFFDQLDPNDESIIDSNTNTNTNTQSSSWIDMEGNQRPQVSLVLAADIIVYSNDASMVANTIQATLQEGGHAIVMGPHENHRFGVEAFPDACRNVGLNVHLTNIVAADAAEESCSNSSSRAEKDQQLFLLRADLEQTSGYSNNHQQGGGYDFTMFTIDKPILGKVR